jgi:hypothetical protein
VTATINLITRAAQSRDCPVDLSADGFIVLPRVRENKPRSSIIYLILRSVNKRAIIAAAQS